MKIVADQNIPHVEACFSHLGEVSLFAGREIAPEAVVEADVLLVRSVTQVNEALLAQSPVKFVATATIGIEHVDLSYLDARGIGFASAPGSNAMSVADWVTASLLALAEKYGISLAGKSMGIVGVGNVGGRVARKCDGLGMHTVLNDPPLARSTGDAQYRPLEDIYECDFVTLHTPLTHDGRDKTYHLADVDFFENLKPGAVFLNAARGGVHDTAALQVALEGGRLQAVALDVWENEPFIDPALLRLVDIATPHIAGYSLDGKIAGLTMIYRATCEYFGLTAKHTTADFLPEPEVKEIELEPSSRTEQEQVFQTVEQVYPIDRDDNHTRGILSVPPAERAAFFEGLRKNYPIRREFQNTNVRGVDKDSRLARMLSGIGFQVD
ncbi:4-phosphoerythronate dehydrogenase [Planctomycetota bacterium]